ncbi:DUF6931 family protein [Acidisoma silvae]|uniref:DUF6931 family protein n=1 Tax=Acidisoma silvae TaxID=2802396 RepID=UPI0038735A6D
MSFAWIKSNLGIAETSPLLDGHPSSLLLIDRLEQADLLDAAICIAAHALPAREAVWWACRCAAHTAPMPHRPLADIAASKAAEAWVRRPDNSSRRRAYAAARQAQFQSAEALAALAVFWAAAEQRLSIQPDKALARLAQNVEQAVRLASYRGSPDRRIARQRHFLASARDIAAGGAGHLPAAGET